MPCAQWWDAQMPGYPGVCMYIYIYIYIYYNIYIYLFKLEYPQSTTCLSTQHLLLVCQQVWNAMQVGDVPQSQSKGEPPMPKPCNGDEATAKYIPERTKHIWDTKLIVAGFENETCSCKSRSPKAPRNDLVDPHQCIVRDCQSTPHDQDRKSCKVQSLCKIDVEG